MKINAQTKISRIIKHNKDAIDVIAGINPLFKKLKNPILRKVLAPRVTIEDAARIGKSTTEKFFEALSAIGFVIEEQSQAKIDAIIEENSTLKDVINSGNVKTLDVRPVLKKGTDPYNHIMEVLKTLPDGYALELVNSFEPTPIIKILNKKGYASIIRTDDGVVKTYLLKLTESVEEVEAVESVSNNDELILEVSIDELEKERLKYKDQCNEIDVRDLEMPLPMVTILNELEDLPEGHALFVHHKKVPQYLLPELKERKLRSWIAEIDDENVKLLIHK
jgi:uncharacterized protein (DUF2249 family)